MKLISKKGRKRLEEHGPKKTGKWLFLQNIPKKIKNMKYKKSSFFL